MKYTQKSIKNRVQRYAQNYETEIGMVCIQQEGEAIISLGIVTPKEQAEVSAPWGTACRMATEVQETSGGTLWQETPLLKQAITELEEYLAGERREFTLPLHTEGTPFQERVWEVLRRIPYGQTLSYGQVAALAGSPKGARAAGMACHCNPIMVFIPCHRVVGSDGSLTGFGGGLAVKEKLLALERKI